MSRRSPLSPLLPLVVALAGVACSSSSSPSDEGSGGQGSGGVSSSGGTTSSGGAGSGGAAGGSTQTATGGTSGTGGVSETGGRSATGGTSALPTGGTTGTGGSVGTGGATGADGGVGATAAGGEGANAGEDGSGGGGQTTGGRSGANAGAGDGGSPGGGRSSAGGTGGHAGATGGQNSGGAASGTGGTGGEGAYNPCKASPCKILPLGDSITLGMGSTDNGGYRSPLFKLVVEANQSITFTGSQMAGPTTVSGQSFPRNHEGYSGYTVESGYSTYGTPGIADKVPAPAFNTIPDIVLLHIGTNDLTSSDAKSTTADRLDKLLTKIASAAPDALVVVAQVIPLGYSSTDWTTYNSKIPGLVEAHAAKGEHMTVVDMSKLPSNQLNGVHPTDQGYATMAGYWYDSIKGYLP
ncbi:MAG: endoglucanase [Polyangiaceae bacterium]|nr:endoglucanase [Polyangiaceae bacterium]